MMTTLNQHGMGLLLAMMIAQGAANEAPAEKASGPAAARPVLIAAGETDAFGAQAKSGAPGKEAEAVDSAFRRLPAEDQRIARALLEAEQVGAGSDAAWSLERIASARASGKDWESIVTEMQTRSLIAAGELKDVLSPRAFASTLQESEQFATDLAVANGPPVEKPQAKKAKPFQAVAVKPASKTRVKTTEIAAVPGITTGSGCDAASAAGQAELSAGAPAPGTVAPSVAAKTK